MRKTLFPVLALLILAAASCAKETLPLEDSFVLGKRDAKHKVVVFYDPDCPICSSLHREMKKVVNARSDIAFYIKLFPLAKIHPYAYRKSKIINCAKTDEEAASLLEQAASWGTYLPEPSCDSEAVERNLALGNSLGLPGTPAVSFSKQDIAYGAYRAEALIAVVDGTARVENHFIVYR